MEFREEIQAIRDRKGRLTGHRSRLVSEWRSCSVDDKEENSMPPERRAEYQRRIEAASEHHPISMIHVG